MGDRAQVKFIFNDKEKHELYFYTHWAGRELEDTVKRAVIRGEDRWSDDEYLARIVFSEMIKDNVLGETGYGIGFQKHGDLQYPLVIVDCSRQTFTFSTGEEISFRALE